MSKIALEDLGFTDLEVTLKVNHPVGLSEKPQGLG